MPPSPSLSRSLNGDPRGDSHKRGRSFENGLSFKERDDDLALFNELQSQEKDNFLLESTDDFEDLLSSKPKSFVDFKLGINIPVRRESSDLLNEDGDKNDYEWLLTPPDTPLFPSLDDEPAPVNLVHCGRSRSRPISISRPSTMDKSHRSSRGSPSPQRLSPSPRSGTSTFRGRPSSAPRSNPGPSHSSSLSRRPSSPQIKPSTPPPRSSTPISRRTSTGSPGIVSMSGMRGTSPVRMSRGNSTSPKVRAWQSNIPGFSLEVPHNLRTSLADRPASYVRGSSPASKSGRQSMSPTPSRSVSSSHSQERDRLSSHGKASIASSGDDDADSLHSVTACFSQRPTSRKGVSGYPNGRPLGFSKKSPKTFSPSSGPKRLLDPSMRQMERKAPPNMFRPLLSSVPSSTFYSGKPSTAHHTLISRNSSVTTSSNTSSDLATSAVLDTEGSDRYYDDRASDCVRATFSYDHDEVFAFDKINAGTENTELENHEISSETQLGEPGYHDHPITTGQLDVQGDAEMINSHGNTLVCSICGSRFRPDDVEENEYNVCFECKQKELLSVHRLEAAVNDSQSGVVSEIVGNQGCALEASHNNIKCSESNPEKSLSESMESESLDVISRQHVTGEHRTFDDSSNTSNGGSDMNINVSEGAGISVLLNRSNSLKGNIVHCRTINSSAVSFEDLSYARDLTSSLRSSFGHGSFSASSSVDLTSTRHGEMSVRRQLSCKLSDSNSKPQSTVSSFSGTSMPMYQSVGLSTSSHDGSTTSPLDQIVALEHAELHNTVSSVDRVPIMMNSQEKDPSLVAACMSSNEAENILREIDKDQQNRIGHIQNERETEFTETSLAEDSTVSENRVPLVDVVEDSHQSSASTMSEIEINESHPSSPRSQMDVVSREDLEESSTAKYRDTDVKDASLESDQADRIVEESTVTVEDQGGKRTRNLTLEEATDTILFCSSIIHDLAYKAASIAIEKEKENLEPFESSRPTITIPDKSSSDRNNPRGFSSSRMPKAQKSRKKRTTETETKPPLTQNGENTHEPVVRNVGLPKHRNSMNPPKLESKCNCTIM